MATEPPLRRIRAATPVAELVDVQPAAPDAAERADLERLRAELAEEALSRAEVRARKAFELSAFHDDQGVADEVAEALAKSRRLALFWVSSEFGLLVTAVSRLHKETWNLAWKGRRTRVGWTAFVVALVVSGFIDVSTGPGPIPDDLSGWHERLRTWSGVVGISALGLGVWAVSDWFDDKSTHSLQERCAAAVASADELKTELDDALHARWFGPAIARVLSAHQQASFMSRLKPVDATKLYGPPGQSNVIRTPPFAVLNSILAAEGGASIGLCGPRGVGKTTVLRQFCDAKVTDTGEPVIGVLVHVPVVYDYNEFLRMLFLKVKDRYESSTLSDAVVGSAGVGRGSSRRTRAVIVATAALLVAAFVWASTQGFDFEARYDQASVIAVAAADSWGLPGWVAWAAVSAVAAVFVATWAAYRGRQGRRAPVRVAASDTRNVLDDMQDVLRKSNDLLSADIALSSTVGGSINVLGAGNVDRSGTRHVSRGASSYQALVDGFKELLETIGRLGVQVRIGFDELDKLDSQDARRFLNSQKVLFDVPRTYFLVSVSEDAMSDFERRGLPIRDAFDSSLDEIIRVEELTVSQSMELLSSRMDYAFPLSFGALCHCFAGGLPRELVRVARKLVSYNAEADRHGKEFGTMKRLCGELIENDLVAKSSAIWVQARSFDVEPYGARFRSWLAASDQSRTTLEGMLATCEGYLALTAVEPTRACLPSLAERGR